MADSHEFRRRVLLLVTTGGFTHAAPVLEIGAVLASRGHDIQFATCEGQEDWTADYPFINTVYTVGPAAAEHDLDLHYESMRLWRHEHGFAPMMKSKYFFDNFWTDTYKSLRALCQDEATRPDFIVADFFADSAARDMLKQFNIQLASIWPQMPYAMAPVSYHPGQPGFQADGALTSEHASLTSRFWNEFVVMAALPTVIPWLLWTKRMRADAGVDYSHSLLPKPDYLVLVNSFWGLEAPKELPPLMAPVGPILSDEYPPLDEDLAQFLDSHDKTIYVSLGTHINLPGEELAKYLLGFIKALDAGFINGVIWATPSKARANFDKSKSYLFADGSILSVNNLLNDAHPDFRLPVFAPQRAVLAHRNTVLFLTHGGGSSANETLFHGTPVLAVGYFFDQLCNSARLAASGVGTSLDKSHVTPSSISSAIANITTDADGLYATNIRRMQRIATLNSKRKHLAADLIEEVMTDQELRFRKGVELRPMHLQTADMRMSIWKARNWDMLLISLTGLAAEDSMRFGKSLTALIAALEPRKKLLPNCGFIMMALIMAQINRDYREATGQFLEKRHHRMEDCEVLSQASSIFGLREAKAANPGLNRISAPLHSRLYESWQQEIAVLIVDESHACRNSDSVYRRAIQSLKYHHILMLTGTPIYNTFSDLFGQTMLLPCGGLFKSLEHFRSIFCPVNEFNPQGVWRDLYHCLYQVLIMAHPKNVIDILPIRVVSREVKLTGRITILRIDTLMVKFDYLSIIDHHCKDGSARKNMFIEAMGVLSQTKQLSACPLLLGGTLCNPKHARPRNLWQQPFNCSEHDTLKLPLTE
ncbi:hypothetical protein KAF25_006321 [Fusarium avenaceum]|uniref:Helicase ATP-binding domain-containing protein n=1 Tax=Fusarium avenaceum TaxID=40199 RepID=A0A9P7KYQ8_9HYPO|nr:hypothetical protein KAF25_006321 [Fusarium avenaceum]